jgi:hypothetical protein
MRGAPGFHRPSGQQQAQDNTEKQLLLLCQAFHRDNLTRRQPDGNKVLILTVIVILIVFNQ